MSEKTAAQNLKDRKYLLFDLDGTLTDSQEGITKSVEYALNYYGIQVEDRKELNVFIGPPLAESFMKYYGFSREKALEAVKKYREYFGVTGKFENTVYEGIPEVLEKLKQAGKILILATSKPEVYAKQIMEHFDLAKYFTNIHGSELDGSRVHKDEVIRFALKANGITDLEEAVMIGDREHDMIGAKKCGLEAIGVLFGFGSRRELEENGAAAIAETAEELGELLCR